MFKFLLLFILISLCERGHAQDRFIVYVAEYMSGNIGGAVTRCPGTIITDRHVLTTAACATPSNSSFQLAIIISISFGSGFVSSTVSASRYFIHPNYTGDVYSNNIGVVVLDGIFNSTSLPPRTLGSIPSSNPACDLFGWGGAPDNPETVAVVPNGPEYCYSNRTQIYCTEHFPPTRACAAMIGSPLVCNPQSIDGILLQTDCLEERPGRYLQPYHSIGEFREWIELVSGAEMINRISSILLLSVLAICLKNSV